MEFGFVIRVRTVRERLRQFLGFGLLAIRFLYCDSQTLYIDGGDKVPWEDYIKNNGGR